MSATAPAPASLPAPRPASPEAGRPLEAPVRRVTLLEDRAQVRRAGEVSLEAGHHRLVIADVAPVVADRTLVARAGQGVRVLEARVVRRVRIGQAEQRPDTARVQAEQERLEAAARRLGVEERVLQHRMACTTQALALMIDSINREAPYATSFEERWARDLEGFLSALRELEARQRARDHEVRQLHSRTVVAALNAPPASTLETTIEVEVVADAPGVAALTVDYMVPCALWRPIRSVARSPPPFAARRPGGRPICAPARRTIRTRPSGATSWRSRWPPWRPARWARPTTCAAATWDVPRSCAASAGGLVGVRGWPRPTT